jgi:hypothetical protein
MTSSEPATDGLRTGRKGEHSLGKAEAPWGEVVTPCNKVCV